MKKTCLFFVAAMLLLSATAFSQESKGRKKLYEAHYNNYRIIHSVISPKGNIIVLTYGGIWYAKDENSPIKIVFNFKDDYNTFYEGLHEILFFNADTVLIVGDLVRHSIYHNPLCLVSHNGGKTWKKHKINTESPHKVHINSKGECWVTFRDGEILYSKDYAKSFKKLGDIFTNKEQGGAICMETSEKGIATSTCRDKIVVTTDNWKSCESIRTPFKDGHLHNSDSSDVGYDKVGVWKNYYLIRNRSQYHKVFYTEKDFIQWKKFPVTANDFKIINDSLIITTNKGTFLFNENMSDYQVYKPRYQKYTDGEKVYTIKDDDTITTQLYTTSPNPRASSNRLEKSIAQKGFLDGFLASDIVSVHFCHTFFEIHGGNQFTNFDFTYKDKDSLVCKKEKTNVPDNSFDNLLPIVMPIKDIRNLLEHINEDPGHISTLKEIDITPSDIRSYQFWARTLPLSYDFWRGRNLYDDTNYYYNFGDQLDTLSKAVFKKYLTEDNESRYMIQLNTKIVNKNGDTLLFSNLMEWPRPYSLPMYIVINGKYYTSYDIGITKFIAHYDPTAVSIQKHKNDLILELAAFIKHLYNRDNY